MSHLNEPSALTNGTCFQYGRKRLSTGNATCTKCACACSELALDFRWEEGAGLYLQERNAIKRVKRMAGAAGLWSRTHTHACRLEGTRASVSMSSGGFAAQNGAGGSYTNGELLALLSRVNACVESVGVVNACVKRVGVVNACVVRVATLVGRVLQSLVTSVTRRARASRCVASRRVARWRPKPLIIIRVKFRTSERPVRDDPNTRVNRLTTRLFRQAAERPDLQGWFRSDPLLSVSRQIQCFSQRVTLIYRFDFDSQEWESIQFWSCLVIY